MAKLSSSMASKLKNLARDAKQDDNSGVKKAGGNNPDVKKKEATLGGKASGKKN